MAVARTARDVLCGRVRLLYVSPERFVSAGFRRFAAREDFPPVSLVCVDEAHCVPLHGLTYRPDYLELGLVRRAFPPECGGPTLLMAAETGSPPKGPTHSTRTVQPKSSAVRV